jgi:hypothetical protein
MAAQVQSTTAISDFRSAMCTFCVEARQAVAAIEMEARRALEYIIQDQAQYWHVEVRRGRDKVQQCKIEIHNARTFKKIANYTPSCIEEKKELAKAERRLQIAEAKVEAVRHWGRAAEQEFREFQARLGQFTGTLDGELPKAVALLERFLSSLDRYLAVAAPQAVRESSESSLVTAAAGEPETTEVESAIPAIDDRDQPDPNRPQRSDDAAVEHAAPTADTSTTERS